MYENIREIKNEVAMNNYPKLLKVQNFMCAGLVSYEDTGDGKYLLRKETLDKMMPTIEGRPVVVDHQEVNLNNLEDVAVGYVTKGWFNSDTGQYDCEILIKDSDVYDRIKQGDNKVSSAYICSDFGNGGRYLGQDYGSEILNGTFTHLAIVDNPRYPDAKILVNSLKGNNKMKLFKTKPEETEVEKVNIDGVEVEFVELINAYKEKLNACKNEDEKENEEEKKEEVKENEEEEKENEEEEKENACKNEDDEKENEDEEKKENEDVKEEKENSDKELTNKIREVVNEVLNEIKKNDNETVCENKNALALKNSYYNPSSEDDFAKNIKTRAERIKEGNKNYSLE